MNQSDSNIDSDSSYSFLNAVLVLEDGQVYVGKPYGKKGVTTGEIVFSTAMTGYQETLTDPSYCKQIIVQTFPHIGNTGVNDEDNESDRIWAAGYAVRVASSAVSNWRAKRSLEDDLTKNEIVAISGIDTRKLVRHLRSAGVMRAGIFSGEEGLKDCDGSLLSIEKMLQIVKSSPLMAELIWATKSAQKKLI